MNQDLFVLGVCLSVATLAGCASAFLLKAELGLARVSAGVLTAADLAVTLWAAWEMPANALFPASCALGWALTALAIADVLAFRLPDFLTLPLIAAGIAIAWLLPDANVIGHAIGAIGGFGSFAILAWLYRRARDREGLGLGDAKLAAAAGAWLGWQALPSVVLVGALGGIVWVLARYLVRGPESLQERMPFGVPLCAAFWLAWLYGPLVPFGQA